MTPKWKIFWNRIKSFEGTSIYIPWPNLATICCCEVDKVVCDLPAKRTRLHRSRPNPNFPHWADRIPKFPKRCRPLICACASWPNLVWIGLGLLELLPKHWCLYPQSDRLKSVYRLSAYQKLVFIVYNNTNLLVSENICRTLATMLPCFPSRRRRRSIFKVLRFLKTYDQLCEMTEI